LNSPPLDRLAGLDISVIARREDFSPNPEAGTGKVRKGSGSAIWARNRIQRDTVLRRGGLGLAATLHLLRMYESVIRVRPLEAGNREFLTALVAASHALGTAVLSAAPPPDSRNAGRFDPGPLLRLLASQKADNARDVSGQVLELLDEALTPFGSDFRRPYLRGPLPLLSAPYASVTVVFGPGVGLGDEITFLQLLRALVRRCGAPTTIFTLYPNLWRNLLPQTREVHYRGRPLRPFAHLEAAARRAPSHRHLVVLADFEFFDAHSKLIPHLDDLDVLEVALGRMAAWLRPGGSPWTQVEHFVEAPLDNNYYVLRAVGERLLGRSISPWQPVRELSLRPVRGRSALGRRLLVNPLSSKPLPITPEGWAKMVRRIARDLPASDTLQVSVFPGLHQASRSYASEVCRRIEESAGPGRPIVSSALLEGESGLSATSALPSLVAALDEFDACLTLDTFTAHLAPLFGVPTAVVAYGDNHQFWVPCRWSFYGSLRDAHERLPGIVSALLAPRRACPGEREGARRTFENLIQLTEAVSAGNVTDATLTRLAASLAEALGRVDREFPTRENGRQWLRVWSRLLCSYRQQPVDRASLLPYVLRWEQSEFFKFASFLAGHPVPAIHHRREPRARRDPASATRRPEGSRDSGL
jgi:hypothetical protein